MKIAQISPLYESVPPQGYGGTERIVHYLTEELVRQGHEVTLYASGDSETSAHLVPLCETSLRLCPKAVDQIAHHVLAVERVAKVADQYDVIHSHIDYFPYSVMRRLATPSVTTLHGRLDLSDLVPIYREFNDIPVVSISNNQREPIPFANWQGTVYHGLPEDLFTFHEKKGDYLAFLGRICPEKRVDVAIEIATKVGIPLKIAAKVDRVDQEYFDHHIAHLLQNPLVEYIGEIGGKEKEEFLGNAYALLFPIDWPEPFGLVMIEAMACGTPVIARALGSVPEVMEDGVTGYIVHTTEEAIEAVKKVDLISRRTCREVFDKRFTAKKMVSRYLEIYKKLGQQPCEIKSIKMNSTF